MPKYRRKEALVRLLGRPSGPMTGLAKQSRLGGNVLRKENSVTALPHPILQVYRVTGQRKADLGCSKSLGTGSRAQRELVGPLTGATTGQSQEISMSEAS